MVRKVKLGPGKCVHCLKEVAERNSDHVFPKSWFPDSTPINLEKWQIPSCIQCNSEYGKLEQDFLINVGLCLDPEHPASATIVRKALRSLKPAAARNSHDARHRFSRGQRILAEALEGDQIPDHGHFPSLGERWLDISGERAAILIPKENFERITEKIVRGISFVEDGIFIEPSYTIDFYALPEKGISPWTETLDKWGKVYTRGPGIIIRRAIAPEDGIKSLIEITFWKQFKTYATVSKSGEN